MKLMAALLFTLFVQNLFAEIICKGRTQLWEEHEELKSDLVFTDENIQETEIGDIRMHAIDFDDSLLTVSIMRNMPNGATKILLNSSAPMPKKDQFVAYHVFQSDKVIHLECFGK